MIRLHLLGAARLEGGERADPRSLLSQPRRLALLAYLALGVGRGAERRDRLLGVFWPESDTDHARGALRSALHFLRVSLGPGVVQSRGSEEVQLELDRLWCDVHAFERHCDAGEFEEALRLYAGDLLDGFFVSGAPEFEQWLDAERSRLRTRAVEAARMLVGEAQADGAPVLAALRLRRLLELAPTDETVASRLMRLLSAAGDRGEALRVFFELQARLENEYGLETSEEIRALAEEIRAGLASVVPPSSGALPGEPPQGRPHGPLGADDGPAAGSSAGGDMPQPANGSPASWRARLRRRGVLVTAAAIGALALVAAPLVVSSGSDDSAPSVHVLAALPFNYRGAAEHAYLAEGLADLLAANLDGAGELRSIDPRALLSRLHTTKRPITPALARREAAAHGAQLFVLGSVTEAGGQLRIAAALYGSDERAGGRAKEVVVEGRVDELLAVVDRLTVGLLEARGTTDFVSAAIRTTHSVEALKAFLNGEAALRRADTRGAIDQYRRATELDSSFALAHYRLSSAAYRRGISRIPARSAEEALRNAGRLVREDSLLVAAWGHHVAGDVAQAYQFYQEALTLRPGHIEADFQLGELLFHWGSSLGIPAAESREPFGRVFAVEPHNVDAGLHLVRLAARDGRGDDVDSLIMRMRRADPDGEWEAETDALRAFLSADTAWQSQTIRAAGHNQRDAALLEGMAAHSYNLTAVERVARERVTLERTPAEQANLQLLLLRVQLARGRYRDAELTLASATSLPEARRLEYRAMMATLPFRPLPEAELASLRTEIAAYPDLPFNELGPLAGRGIEYPMLLWPGMYRPRRLYLLGALEARLGDTAAVAVADTLAQEHVLGHPGPPFNHYYERLTRARIAEMRGRPAAGLDALGPVQRPPVRTFESLVDHGRVYERWVRAELLRATGRLAEALRWYGTFPDPLGRDLAYLAPSHLRRADIYDTAGDSTQAVFHYRRFIDLWTDADPELQPQLAHARTRLRELARRE